MYSVARSPQAYPAPEASQHACALSGASMPCIRIETSSILIVSPSTTDAFPRASAGEPGGRGINGVGSGRVGMTRPPLLLGRGSTRSRSSHGANRSDAAISGRDPRTMPRVTTIAHTRGHVRCLLRSSQRRRWQRALPGKVGVVILRRW